ncbi:hypothetical protein [Listeria booriae]|uniref:hypothetical protein n=1 Tax=Listeria booriae TaxID=1552123 RepID=UPI00162ABA63|nr:hypothetical protein [Listeria booriae]
MLVISRNACWFASAFVSARFLAWMSTMSWTPTMNRAKATMVSKMTLYFLISNAPSFAK